MAVLRERCLGGEPVDILIGGHTHLERLEHREGAVLINPGSPTLPHHKDTRLGSVGLLELAPGRLHAAILPLGHSPGRPNPVTPVTMELIDGRPVRLLPGDTVAGQAAAG